MSNFKKTTVDMSASRTELHDLLDLTGSEVSINNLTAGAKVPFVHIHKKNEEVYGVLAGKGFMNIDGEDIALNAGDWLRVDPSAKRQLRAAEDSAITVLCIQAQAGSLADYSLTDGVIV